MRYVLGIDIGSYSTKGVLVDPVDGRVCATAQLYHQIDSPEIGFYEHDPDEVWWKDTVGILDQLISTPMIATDGSTIYINPSEISCVAISAIAPCVCMVDKQGKPLMPAILYGIDGRAQKEILEFENQFSNEDYQKITGHRLSTQSAGPKILWIKKNHPEVYQRTHKILTASSYIVYCLTDQFVQDYYTASFYDPFFDINDKKWSHYAEELIEIDKLPELKAITDIAGYVTEEASIKTGLAKGTPVIVGSADAYTEGVSCGFSILSDLFVMLGSSNFFLMSTDVIERNSCFWSSIHLNCKDYVLAGGMATSGSLTEWIRNTVFPKKQALSSSTQETSRQKNETEDFYHELNLRIKSMEPGGSHLLMLPYFLGERTPIQDPNAKGMIIGLTLATTSDDIYHASLESIAFGIRHNLQEAGFFSKHSEHERRSNLKRETLLVAGGGTHNKIFLQILSDVCQIKIAYPENGVGACYGDAFLASVALEINSMQDIKKWVNLVEIYPNRENHLIYDQLFKLYLDLYKNNNEIMNKLSATY